MRIDCKGTRVAVKAPVAAARRRAREGLGSADQMSHPLRFARRARWGSLDIECGSKTHPRGKGLFFGVVAAMQGSKVVWEIIFVSLPMLVF